MFTMSSDDQFRSVQKLNTMSENVDNKDKKPPESNIKKADPNESSVSDKPDTVVSGGLVTGHFQERVITVSNAPPVSLKKGKDSGKWEIAQGSGGLVTCCDPVMSKDSSNVWLACFGPDVPLSQIGTPRSAAATVSSQTNSLGLPIVRPACTKVHLSMLQDPQKDEDSMKQEVKEQMSLMGILRDYSKETYSLNPVVIPEMDYNTYYGGISNGLLWPAFHNLPEYIVNDYNKPAVVKEHWLAYVRVNYLFALNAVRNSRPQDFLWIHDYHLILTGLIIQSLDPVLEVGFFLHIPFQPPEQFFNKFKTVAEAVLRGMLRFTKVGFQTNRDRQSFVNMVTDRFPTARIQFNEKIDKHVVTFENFSASLGVFPVSVKNEDFIKIAETPDIKEEARKIREQLLGGRSGKIFFSVERFDYTKGIKEKLKAYRLYYDRHPDRIGKDVFLQVAVTNRRTVDTYRQYQDTCIELAKQLNEQVQCKTDKNWKPLIFQMDGLKRPNLVAHYLAMDIGVVTPCADGMNLVAKEMLICNPKASLVLSCGAGTDQQFSIAGFYSDSQKCYHRIPDINNSEAFADVLYNAVVEDPTNAESHSRILRKFLLSNSIDQWSESFLDPSWRHDVVQVSTIKSFQAFYGLMFKTRNVRREIVHCVLKGQSIPQHYWFSLKNAKISLEKSCQPGSTILMLTTILVSGPKASAKFDISHEIRQLEIDEAFLNYVQSVEFDNLEQFLQYLAKCHSGGLEQFNKELEKVIHLLTRGDHFQHFFTDRDGTMTDYACSYPSSIQGAYSGVIQATFAQRCTQCAAIVTSAPLQNIGILDVTVVPEGYFCYGASGGREWYINSQKKFKDTSITLRETNLLNALAKKITDQLAKHEFALFGLIGSGFQRLHGNITVAKQDIYKSVDEIDSADWLHLVSDLVKEVDPGGVIFHIQVTETDIKIGLKSKSLGQTFNKGHGIRLFVGQMSLNLGEGNILLCADSETDLPMLQEVLNFNPQNVYTVWVTKNEELKHKVIEMCQTKNNQNYAFASNPLVLLGAMAQATIRETKIRPKKPAPLLFDFDD